MIGRQCEGGPAQFRWINAQQQMVHDGISNHDQFQNLSGVNFRFDRSLTNQIAQAFAHGLGHFDLSAWIHHDIADPAHQVFPKADLRVHRTNRCDDIAGLQICQMHRHCGGPNINRTAKDPVVKARPDINQFMFIPDRGGDLPFALTQCLLQYLDDR